MSDSSELVTKINKKKLAVVGNRTEIMAEDTKELQEKPKLPVKHDWYQTETAVVITVMVKNIQSDHLKVDIREDKVNVTISHPDYELCELCFNLMHKVASDKSSYKLTSSKIEIKLFKTEGLRWENLEGTPTQELKAIILEPSPQLDKPPSYPTSKKGKDWSVVEKEIKELEAQEKPEGEEAVNKLFQEIYGKGSDEVKRAMNKSYMESGGTVLSTNWNEISKQKVDVKPPDGMEFKKWSE